MNPGRNCISGRSVCGEGSAGGEAPGQVRTVPCVRVCVCVCARGAEGGEQGLDEIPQGPSCLRRISVYPGGGAPWRRAVV